MLMYDRSVYVDTRSLKYADVILFVLCCVVLCCVVLCCVFFIFLFVYRYSSLAPADGSEFTVVVVNEDDSPAQLTLQVAGTLSKFAGPAASKLHPLQQWRSIETEYLTNSPHPLRFC